MRLLGDLLGDLLDGRASTAGNRASDIVFNTVFKPTSSIKKKQTTLNNEGFEVDYVNSGRHDPCVVPRAVPVVESMTAICLIDMYLLNLSSRINKL